MEAAVRAAASAFLSFSPPPPHPSAVALVVTAEGLQENPGCFIAGTMAGGHPAAPRTKIVRVHVLEGGLAAEVQVQWDYVEVEEVRWMKRGGFLTLLQHAGEWVVIAAVTAATKSSLVTPADFAAVAAACWDEYGGANRACDADRMAKVFHPQCRLTYTGSDGAVVIKSQQEFLAMVRDRYSTPMHAPYAHLRDDPRAAAGDTLLSITFATPDLAMVVLKVGHPPCLWTDLLTCARIGTKWWIVAKSSCKEPLLEDEARSEDGGGKRAKTEAGPSN